MSFISPTGYIELDDDCEYSIDRKSTRSRESINPKDDLAFYFNTYIVPKYGLDNINVNNVASFMKDLEMNWTKVPGELKDQVLNILVDGIFNKDTSFKNDFLNKLNGSSNSSNSSDFLSSSSPSSSSGKSSFTPNGNSESHFGFPTDNSTINILIFILILAVMLYLVDKHIK